MTQSELADLAGTSQKTVANIEKGDNVTIDKFTEIANALGKRVKITLT
ncbi:transcriptional regulator [Weissella koreensis KCTC 3621]|nr:transcriptional regulator [Weissella koreensis KCTC 3621]